MSMSFWNESSMYSKADKERILSKFDSGMHSVENTSGSDWSSLLHLRKKKLKTWLHAVSLTDYCKAERIPRGLRIQKPPAMFLEDEEFKSKWINIMNRCSADLMLLIIERSYQETEDLDKKLREVEGTLKETSPPDEFDSKYKEMETQLKQLESKIREFKNRKFTRDLKDYSQSRVYVWTIESNKTKKRVTWADKTFSSSEGDSTGGEEEPFDYDEPGPSYRRNQERSCKSIYKEPFLPQRSFKRNRKKI